MNIESREHRRVPIPKYYAGGNFHLLEGEREYHYIRANDICVSGIGLDIPSALSRGSRVKVRYNSSGWRADLEGTVMWCERMDRVGISKSSYENYRVGIRLDPRKADQNALLYLNLKQELETLQSAARA